LCIREKHRVGVLREFTVCKRLCHRLQKWLSASVPRCAMPITKLSMQRRTIGEIVHANEMFWLKRGKKIPALPFLTGQSVVNQGMNMTAQSPPAARMKTCA
jgi:hypothetical protein